MIKKMKKKIKELNEEAAQIRIAHCDIYGWDNMTHARMYNLKVEKIKLLEELLK